MMSQPVDSSRNIQVRRRLDDNISFASSDEAYPNFSPSGLVRHDGGSHPGPYYREEGAPPHGSVLPTLDEHPEEYNSHSNRAYEIHY